MPDWSAWLLVLLALGVLVLLADFLWLYLRGLRFRVSAEGREDQASYRGSELLAQTWYLALYKWLPTLRVRLKGVGASADTLYDGQMLAAAAGWWNDLLRSRRGFRLLEAHPLDAAAVERMQATVEPKNAPLLRAYARHSAPFDTLAEACLALGYSLARVFGAGTNSDWLQARQRITEDDLTNNNFRYQTLSIDISNLGDVPSEGFWREMELRSLWNRHAIAAIRWAYRDQVRRWERAEGRDMGQGVGFSPLTEGRLVNKFADLLFENGGRFLETETAYHREAQRSALKT